MTDQRNKIERPSGWTIAWLLWLSAFVVMETIALLTKGKDATLSATTWVWFAVWHDAKLRKTRLSILASFLIYLGVHLRVGVPGWPLIPLGAGVATCIYLSTFVWRER